MYVELLYKLSDNMSEVVLKGYNTILYMHSILDMIYILQEKTSFSQLNLLSMKLMFFYKSCNVTCIWFLKSIHEYVLS